jgi:hypothetical protein
MFNTPEDAQVLIDEYFNSLSSVDAEGMQYMKPATITGLAIALGFCSRQSMYDYEKKPEFTYTIKTARLKVENSYEINLFGKTATGAIFGLKNMGWTDKQEVTSTNVNLNSDLTDDERTEALDKIKKGLDDFEDYK